MYEEDNRGTDQNNQGNFSGSYGNDSSQSSAGSDMEQQKTTYGEASGTGTDTTAAGTSYGSSSYSNYNYGTGSGSNSYGSYDYTNTGSASGTQSGTSYGSYQYSNGYQGMPYGGSSDGSDGNGGKKKKGKGGIAGKIAICIAFGLIFGVCCGFGIWAVQKTAGQNSAATAVSKTAEVAPASAGTSNAAAAASSQQAQVTTTAGTDNATVATDVTQVVKNVMPSIVAIDNNYKESVQSIFGQVSEEEATASGSGIIVGKSDTELLIVTNNHVVENADSLKVQFIDGTKAEADVKGTDPDMDLAVIAVQLKNLDSATLSKIAVATLGDSNALQVGEPAIAIGNALGYGQSVTTGVISALNRKIELEDGSTGTFIQTDAAINPGNSGGALLNSKGEVIGINSSKIGGTTVEGMGYAIPMSSAQPDINKLMNEETKVKVADAKRGYLGVSVMTPTGVEGAYVAEVGKGSAAEKGGIEAGDIITKVNDTEITSREDLVNALKYYEAGTQVTVSVLRKGDGGYQEEALQVTLESASDANVGSSDSSSSQDSGDQQMPEQQQGQSQQGQGSESQDGSQSFPFSNFGF
ncbi:MAG: trypsin-like peptidase domain-containing protein [Butyrivibrio sp.]|nr:trypsin-like peptidase domain-containing protein [Butyrivibrio sp.]